MNMITITRHIKINPLTVFLFAFSSVFHYPAVFFLSYGTMVLHEAAHGLTAHFLGLKIDYIVLEPFGLSLRLKNRIVKTMAEEIILYLSGPLVNILAALGAILMYRYFKSENLRLFYMANTVLFFVNLLPAMPLDGGAMARCVMTRCFGLKRGIMISNILSFFICCAVLTMGIYAAVLCRNYTFLILCSLLIGNLFLSSEQYKRDYMDEIAKKLVIKGM